MLCIGLDPQFHKGPQNIVEYFAMEYSEVTVTCPLLIEEGTGNYGIGGRNIWMCAHKNVSKDKSSKWYQQSDGSLRIRSVTDEVYMMKIKCFWNGRAVEIKFTRYTG